MTPKIHLIFPFIVAVPVALLTPLSAQADMVQPRIEKNIQSRSKFSERQQSPAKVKILTNKKKRHKRPGKRRRQSDKSHPSHNGFSVSVLRNPLPLLSEPPNSFGAFADSKNILFEPTIRSQNQQIKASGTATKGSGSPFAYSYKTEGMALNAGISWISNIADANGVAKAFEDAGFEASTDRLSGLNLNLGARYGAFTLTGGYIHALDNSPPAPLSLEDNQSDPIVWNGELAYTTEVLRKETVLAVGYQDSSEALKLYLPDRRYITKASMAIFDKTTWTLEYYIDKDLAAEKGGANEDGYGVTTKIGFGF